MSLICEWSKHRFPTPTMLSMRLSLRSASQSEGGGVYYNIVLAVKSCPAGSVERKHRIFHFGVVLETKTRKRNCGNRAGRTESFKEIEKRAEAAQTARDEALRTLHQRELEIQEWKLKNAQQAETIALLRRELSQSRDQTTNWQDHFLRVEQQRCTLTSRLEELVAERRPPAPSKPPISTLALKQSATPNTLAEPPTQPRRPVQTKFVRRVQATYEIKAESEEEDQLSPEGRSPPGSSSYRRVVDSGSSDEYDEDDEGDEDELMIGPDTAGATTKSRRNAPAQPAPPEPVKKRKAVRATAKPGPAKKRS
ncbi:hypothetical protein BDZ89DRAFT_1242146 [Hymenopellis radicata]|nr:hypothetical protein BDZ89DRAFT_1242146 [Hymenopellis radicata]